MLQEEIPGSPPIFAKKIVNCKNIEELETILCIPDLMIPAHVRMYDQEEYGERYDEEELERAREIMKGDGESKIFGVALEVSCPDPGSDYPKEIKDLISYLSNRGLKSDGIFRKSPNKEMLESIMMLMDKHQPVNFDDYDIYTLASVLKQFIRDLPDTLIPESSYSALSGASIMIKDDAELIPFVCANFIKPLDDRREKLLKNLMLLIAMTAQLSHINRMSTKALAVVWAPNLIKMDASTDELKIITAVIRVVECMINNYDVIFCNES